MPSRPTWMGFMVITLLLLIGNSLGALHQRHGQAFQRARLPVCGPFTLRSGQLAALAVLFQELGHAADGLAQIVLVGQKHDAEVVWVRAS